MIYSFHYFLIRRCNMGVASLVLGIMGLVISLFWGKLGIFALILAIPADSKKSDRRKLKAPPPCLPSVPCWSLFQKPNNQNDSTKKQF